MGSHEEEPVSRRDFLSSAGWGSLVLLGTLGTFQSLRFMVPNVLFEPPPVFDAGKLDQYGNGAVKFFESRKVFVCLNEQGVSAVSGVCTHLGCTVRWNQDKQIFECPCHGSKFYKNGVNYAGPAPRPLDQLAVNVTEDGNIQVDTAKIINA
ncbi:MAG: Rieske 2Fe-2S domain-containing protein [Armatimonadetes bacterium]|nr:Rieske 2Fe-2S domain-containing protein [Armatimonadota bacterium]